MSQPNTPVRFSPLALRLGLALALLAGVFAAWAQPAQAAGKLPAPAAAVSTISWTAKLSDTKVTVSGSGFPKLRVYYVKARYRLSDPWVRLGAVEANLQGKISKSFLIPAKWVNKPYLKVCLKDVNTSALYCYTARRTY